jgi:alanine racemase
MDSVELIRQRHLPFVSIDGRVGGGFPVVGIDDRSAAREAMRHLLDLGHRHIAVVSFFDEPQLSSASQVKAERLAGYREAVAAVGLPEAGALTYIECESSAGGGRDAAERIVSEGELPTAVIAMSDVIALGLLEAFGERGVTVPEEISVVGFDDIPEARLVRPRLTTVSQHGFAKGRVAADILMRLISGEEPAHHTVLDAQLVVRESAGPVR